MPPRVLYSHWSVDSEKSYIPVFSSFNYTVSLRLRRLTIVAWYRAYLSPWQLIMQAPSSRRHSKALPERITRSKEA